MHGFKTYPGLDVERNALWINRGNRRGRGDIGDGMFGSRSHDGYGKVGVVKPGNVNRGRRKVDHERETAAFYEETE